MEVGARALDENARLPNSPDNCRSGPAQRTPHRGTDEQWGSPRQRAGRSGKGMTPDLLQLGGGKLHSRAIAAGAPFAATTRTPLSGACPNREA